MNRSLYTRASLGVLIAMLMPSWARATDTVVTTGTTQTTGVTLTNTDTLTVQSGGTLSVGGVPVIASTPSTDLEIVNDGSIISNVGGTAPPSAGVPALVYAAPAGGTLTVENNGLIRARRGPAFATNTTVGQTGSTDFTNTGDIEALTNGGSITIPIGGGGTAPFLLAMSFGRGDDTLTNSGSVGGEVFMGLGDDTVNILTGSEITGIIHGDDGTLSYHALGTSPTSAQIDAEGGTINFIGSIDTKTSLQEVGSLTGPAYAVFGFRDVHFQSGYWTLSADVQGRVFTIDSGATVELHDSDARFNEFVVWHEAGEALVNLVNNGHMIFYNDLTTYSTDDGLNYNIAGTGTLDLYNQAASNTGVFQFGATGGFGGGLNLHGGTVLLVSDYTGDINVDDGGILRIGGNLIDDPNSSDPSEIILGTGGGTTGNVIGNLVIDGTLIFDRSNDITFAGDLSGSGLIVKEGTGTATLSGTFNYAGDMQILGGFVDLTGEVVNTGTTSIGDSLLKVNGAISSDVEVGAGGELGGSGTINGNVNVGSGGTVGPGNSPGTMDVIGNFTLSTGSTYEIETLPDGTSDRIVVTGGALTIEAGATAAVLAGGATYSLQTQYTVATATDGVSGEFDTVTSNLAFLDPTLTYGATSITLTLTRNDVAFADLAETENQAGVGAAVQTMDDADPVFLAVLNADFDGAADAFDALSGEAHASVQSVGLSGSSAFLGQLSDRLDGLAQGPQFVQVASLSTDAGAPGQPESHLWGEIFGSAGSLDGAGGAAGVDFERSGLQVGFDAAPGVNSRVGIAAGYHHGDLDITDRASQADVEAFDLAAYGGTRTGGLVLRGSVGYSTRAIETERNVVVGLLTEHLEAEYDATALLIEAEVSHPVQGEKARFEPFLGLAHVALETDAFNETGGSSALTGAEAESSVTFATLGVRAAHDYAGGSLFGTLAWRNASGDIAPETDMAFASDPGANFTVAGAPIAENAAMLEAGLSFALGGAQISASYRGEIADDAEDHGGRVRLNWSF